MSLNLKTSTYSYIVLIVAVILLILLFSGVIALGGGEKIVIKKPEGEGTIFVDSVEKKSFSNPNKDIVLKNIEPGLHSILISRVGYWPWFKEVLVVEKEVKTLTPFFVLENSSGLIVTEEDPEYQTIVSKISSVVPASFADKKISQDGKVGIWVDGGSLFAEWLGDEKELPSYYCNDFGCHTVVVPLGVTVDIRNLDFYKDRNDVIIASFGTGIFAIEADTTGNQNFQPIFEGESPNYILAEDGNSIYVLSNETLLQVAI